MELAAGDINLATDEPEVGPAFDGSPTPVNIIAGNIYDRLLEAAYDEWYEVKDLLEEESDRLDEVMMQWDDERQEQGEKTYWSDLADDTSKRDELWSTFLESVRKGEA